MSEAFYQKFSELIFNVIAIILAFISTLTLLLAYFTTQNLIFFYAYAGALFFIFVYMVQYAKKFQSFMENLYLFIPAQKVDENSKDLNMNVEDLNDLSLKVCLLYQKGYGFESIAKELSLNHPEQAKRLLRKGLTVARARKAYYLIDSHPNCSFRWSKSFIEFGDKLLGGGVTCLIL